MGGDIYEYNRQGGLIRATVGFSYERTDTLRVLNVILFGRQLSVIEIT